MAIPMYEDVMQNNAPGDAFEAAEQAGSAQDASDTMADLNALAARAGSTVQMAVGKAPPSYVGWGLVAAAAWWLFS